MYPLTHKIAHSSQETAHEGEELYLRSTSLAIIHKDVNRQPNSVHGLSHLDVPEYLYVI